MPKDRLIELKQKQKKNDSSAVNVENDETESESQSLRKAYERAEVLTEWITKIEENVVQIRQYLRNTNDIQVNRKEINSKIDTLFSNNKVISQQITTKLKEFDAELKKLQNKESAEGRIKQIQFNTLKTRYHNAFTNNTKELENYKNIQKRILEAQIKAKGINVTDEELTHLLEDGTDIQVFTENILAETAEAKRMLADIEDRHVQLLKIEQMLTDVRDLFVEMAILVENQQELLNRVEYQAQQAQEYVGKVDMGKIRKLKKKGLIRKIWIITILIIVIVIILVIIFKT